MRPQYRRSPKHSSRGFPRRLSSSSHQTTARNYPDPRLRVRAKLDKRRYRTGVKSQRPRCATSRCIVTTFTVTGTTRSTHEQLDYSILIRGLRGYSPSSRPHPPGSADRQTRDVREGASRPEHLENLLSTLVRRGHGSYTPAQDNAEPFASVALVQDHVAGAIVSFP
jgi:hypothetical protein